MAKKNILKKIVGVVLALALLSSVCIMPQATNEFLPDGAQKTLVYEFDFDKSTMTCGDNVDGVKVCGGAYAQIAGKEGNGLKASISDQQNRSLAFNDTQKWLTLDKGSYYATYDYRVTTTYGETTSTPMLKFIKILNRDSGFWGNSADPNYQKSISNDLVGDYTKGAYDASPVWTQGGVYFDIDADNSYFGLIARTSKAVVILDNIKIYKITGYAQPAVYDFDSHNFYDGWAQTASENTIDGLDGRTKNTNTEFLHGTFTMTGVSGTRSTAGIGGFYNVVNVESGSSRSYFVDSTAVKYNNGTAYPGLANSGHNNVLRFGWSAEANKPDSLTTRGVALNNGNTALKLDPGSYRVYFDYYVSADIKDVEMRFVYGFTETSSGKLTGTVKYKDVIFDNASPAVENEWISDYVDFEIPDDVEYSGIGFSLYSNSGKNQGTEVFLDNITIVCMDSDDEYHFDYGINKDNEFYKNHQYIYDTATDEDGNKYMTIADMLQGDGTSTYGGAERGMVFGTVNESGENVAKHLDKGVYAISFRYSFATIPNKTFENGYISFGGAINTESFNTVATGQVNKLATVKDTTLTSGKQEDTWYTYRLLMFVDAEAGIDFALTCENLLHSYKLDDIVIANVTKDDLTIEGESFTVDGDYIIMNGARTTVGELKEGSKYGQSFVVTRGETVINDDEAFVATGDTVELKYVDIDTLENTISYDQKTVIVLNDVNCDGDVDILDLVIVKKAVKNLLGEKFTPAELRALGIANGGSVTDAKITALRTELLATGSVTINAQAVNSVNP